MSAPHALDVNGCSTLEQSFFHGAEAIVLLHANRGIFQGTVSALPKLAFPHGLYVDSCSAQTCAVLERTNRALDGNCCSTHVLELPGVVACTPGRLDVCRVTAAQTDKLTTLLTQLSRRVIAANKLLENCSRALQLQEVLTLAAAFPECLEHRCCVHLFLAAQLCAACLLLGEDYCLLQGHKLLALCEGTPLRLDYRCCLALRGSESRSFVGMLNSQESDSSTLQYNSGLLHLDKACSTLVAAPRLLNEHGSSVLLPVLFNHALLRAAANVLAEDGLDQRCCALLSLAVEDLDHVGEVLFQSFLNRPGLVLAEHNLDVPCGYVLLR